MDDRHEAREINEVVERLRERFPPSPRTGSAPWSPTRTANSTADIRDFVPVFVERSARTILTTGVSPRRTTEAPGARTPADPRFAARLDLDRAAQRRRHLQSFYWWLLGIGISLALVGSATAQGVISSARRSPLSGAD